MVTTQEARAQVQQARQQVQQRRQQIQTARLRELSAEQKRKQTQQQLSERRIKEQQFGSIKQQELQKLKPIEQQIQQTEKEIKRVEDARASAQAKRDAFERDLSIATRAAGSPGKFIGLTKSQAELKRQIQEGRIVADIRGKALGEKAVAQKISEELQLPETLKFEELTPEFFGGLTKQARTQLEEKQLIGIVTKETRMEEPTTIIDSKVEGGKPLQISESPSQFNVFKEFVKKKGPVTGTIDYVGEKISGIVRRREEKLPIKEQWQPQTQARLTKIGTTIGPYFTPLGPTLIFATGAEKLTFGKEDIKRQQKELQKKFEERGTPSFFAKQAAVTISYGVPVGEMGLGLFGIKSQMKTGLIERAPTKTELVGTIQKTDAGVKVDVLSKTTKGPQEEFILGKQIIKPTTKGESISIEKGYRVTDDISLGMKGIPPKGEPIITDVKRFVSVSKVKELGKGFATRRTQELVKRAELGKGFIVDKTTGIISKKAGDVFSFIGGKSNILVDKSLGKISRIIRQPTIKGKLKTIPAEVKPSDVKIIQPADIKKTPLSSTFTAQEEKAVSGFIGSLAKVGGEVPSPSIVSKVPPITSFGGSIMTSTTPQEIVTITETSTRSQPTQNLFTASKLTGFIKPVERETQRELLGTSLPQPQTTREETKIIQTPKISQTSLTITSTALKQPQIQIPVITQIPKQKQILKKIPKQITRTITTITPIPKPRRITPPPKLTSDVDDTKLVKKLVSLRKKGVDVVVGQKLGRQKTIAKNLPPFRALRKGLDFVDKNIEASVRLKPSGKETRKKDIKPFNAGRKFRPSKRNILFIVEKRRFRLDSPGEKKQIKLVTKKVKRKLRRK